MVYTCDLIFMGQPLARTVAHSVQWPGWVVLMTFFKIRDTETYYLFYMEYSKSDQWHQNLIDFQLTGLAGVISGGGFTILFLHLQKPVA